MIAVDCLQGSEQWDELRKGIPTVSQFGRIVTPKQLKLSASRMDYQLELVAERLPGYVPKMPTWDMERGTQLEPDARARYEFQTDVDVEQVGFVWGDESKTWGGSPDGLVSDGGVEFKCPKAETHLKSIMKPEVPGAYLPQVWGSMLITGRKWWDWVSYHPELELVIVRVERDESYEKWEAKFIPALETFLKELEELKARFV